MDLKWLGKSLDRGRRSLDIVRGKRESPAIRQVTPFRVKIKRLETLTREKGAMSAGGKSSNHTSILTFLKKQGGGARDVKVLGPRSIRQPAGWEIPSSWSARR